MKTILYSVLLCLLICSCKKQVSEKSQSLPSSSYDTIDPHYLKNVQAYLEKNMNNQRFQSLNWNRAQLSKEESGWYLRLGYGM